MTRGFLYIIVLAISTSWLSSTAWSSAKGYIDLLDIDVKDLNDLSWKRYKQESNLEYSQAKHTNQSYFHNLYKRQSDSNNNGNNNNNMESKQLLTNKAFDSCRTPSGEAGSCRHVIYCRLPELKDDIWRLVSHLCIIEGRTIGICCPNRTALNLGPQIISDVNGNDVNDLRIVTHPEERGCGIATRQFPEISSSRIAEPDEWPWMAAIIRPGLAYVWCGGVLVTDRHVLTAAHCIHNIDKVHLYIRLGEYNTLLRNETRARDFRIATLTTHVDYNPFTYDNDIGLIRVDRPTIFNTYIWPICMPPISEDWTGRMGIVTGWGSKNFGGPHSEILMEVGLPIWELEECREAMLERVPDTMLCAGYPKGGPDSCQGDSGGPLMLQLPNRRWITIGIVSWGVRCGEPNRPGMYTRVDKYLHWIIENSNI